MPSWNIHIAHVQRLLERADASDMGIRDVNAFLVGNFVPDIYVGFMVPDASRHIDYKLTHLSARESIPLPDYQMFWDFYIDSQRRPVTDLTLGAWSHLVADHVYNQSVRELARKRGLKPGEKLRVAKQGDFAYFGSTLPLELMPHVNDALIEQCRHFRPYSIGPGDVRATVEVARGIVEQAQGTRPESGHVYELLDEDFFHAAFERTEAIVRAGLERFATGSALSRLG